MLTRCPYCQTTFRVTAEQLTARQGQVRCGGCRGVFNALASLADEVAVVPAVEPLAEPSAAGTVDESPAALASAGIAAPAVEAAPPVDFPFEPEVATAESQPAPDGAAVPDAESEPAAVVVEPRPDAAEPPEAIESKETPESEEQSPTVPHEAEEADDLPEAWAADDAPPPRRWPALVGSLLLVLLAAGQLLYIYRVELAVLLPEARPMLVAGCAAFECTIPRPRKPELVGIESSDLAPEGADRLLLTANLRNRAPFAQDYPHLELTLTDTRDSAVVRKVLAPNDYLTAEHPETAGFAAQGEVPVRLLLEAKGVPAVGYRLYLFYP